ncbi:unnamed protein product, partial [marine sediment metagenome]
GVLVVVFRQIEILVKPIPEKRIANLIHSLLTVSDWPMHPRILGNHEDAMLVRTKSRLRNRAA